MKCSRFVPYSVGWLYSANQWQRNASGVPPVVVSVALVIPRSPYSVASVKEVEGIEAEVDTGTAAMFSNSGSCPKRGGTVANSVATRGWITPSQYPLTNQFPSPSLLTFLTASGRFVAYAPIMNPFSINSLPVVKRFRADKVPPDMVNLVAAPLLLTAASILGVAN